jgi:hypothetical protein
MPARAGIFHPARGGAGTETRFQLFSIFTVIENLF